VRWAKWPKAVAKVTDDLDVLLAFYDFPAKHWNHLRTTNPIVILSAPSPPCARAPGSPRDKAPGLPKSPWLSNSSSPSCSTTVVTTVKR
jgi:hypothetical protein